MSDEPRRVLLVHSRVGGGHVSAARALAAELEALGARTRLVDAYLECGSFPLTLFPAAYARLARDHPRLWAALYRGTNGPGLPSEVVLGPFLKRGVERVMNGFRPHLVVSVLPVVNGVLARARGRGRSRLEVVLTDWYAVHRTWVAPGVDRYTAPTDPARLDCLRFGARDVDVVGLPVRREFGGPPASVEQRAATLSGLGLAPEVFTVLIMVGAEGSPRSLANIRAVLAAPLAGAQVVVVAGRNERLRQQVEALPSAMPRRAVGFVDNVAELMRAADVLVTKAGGLTLAEAFCTGVPVVVQDVLPGQEEGNLAYARQHAAVEYAQTPSELAHVTLALRQDEPRRRRLAERATLLARPHAAKDIAEGLLARIDA